MTKRRNEDPLVTMTAEEEGTQIIVEPRPDVPDEPPTSMGIIPEHEAEPAPVPEVEPPRPTVPWDSFEAKIVEPMPEDHAPAEQTSEPIPHGYRKVVYTGLSDVFEHAGFQLRPGQPVIVPSDVVEDLLTFPFESFELIEE